MRGTNDKFAVLNFFYTLLWIAVPKFARTAAVTDLVICLSLLGVNTNHHLLRYIFSNVYFVYIISNVYFCLHYLTDVYSILTNQKLC